MTEYKECTKCKQVKPVEEFYFVIKSAPNPIRIAQCKVCERENQKLYDSTHEDDLVSRKRARMKYEAKNNKTERRRKQMKAIALRQRILHPEKYKARSRFRSAIATGKIKRQYSCEEAPECEGRIEAHHYLGYEGDHWKDVKWLCNKHHMIDHGRYIQL